MSITASIQTFIENPFPLWEKDLTEQLVLDEWKTLAQSSITPNEYTTARGYYKNAQFPASELGKVYGSSLFNSICIEYPQPEFMGSFYAETGLELLAKPEVAEINGVEKITLALEMLAQVPGVLECVSQLVKCIGILKQDNPEIDTSHSDPDIPFTIFISVCKDSSEISNLRVAESILHEAMHLKLTLIEHHIKLVVPGTATLFYSPWRDEDRPLHGILHGLFVFRAVKEFLVCCSGSKINYIKNRILEIEFELESIQDFEKNCGLTKAGNVICFKLLKKPEIL